MCAPAGAAQLHAEAGAAWHGPVSAGSRAAYLIASVTASWPLHVAAPFLNVIRGIGHAASASARGAGRAAYT